MVRSFQLLAALLLVATPALAGTEHFPVTGRDVQRGAFRGQLTVETKGFWGTKQAVTYAVTFDQGGAETWTGEGKWKSGKLSIDAKAVRGAAATVETLGQPSELPPPVKLELTANEQRTSWTVVLSRDGTEKARGTGSRPTYTGDSGGYARFEGVPFVKGASDEVDIHQTDPQQGKLANCYMIAGLMSAAQRRPEQVRRAITDHGDGTLTVKVDGRSWLIDNYFPATGGAPTYSKLADSEKVKVGNKDVTRYELWPMMLERAMAANKGGYDQIKGGNPLEVYSALGIGTHHSGWAKNDSAEALATRLREAIEAGRPTSLTFPDKQLPSELASSIPVYGWHAYQIETTKDGGFVLRNPWGSSHPSRPLTAEELRTLNAYISIGE